MYLCLDAKENFNSKEKIVRETYDSSFLLNKLCKAKNNNKDDILFFIEKYKPIINKYAFKYKLKNFDQDDLVQIGNISVITAIKKYDISKGEQSIDSYIINSIKNGFRNLARGQIKYNDESSLNISVDEDIEIEDLITDSFNLEEYIVDSSINSSLKSILNTLSPSEYQLIKVAYLTPNTTLYRYCIEHNWNYPKKRRELIILISKIQNILLNQ